MNESITQRMQRWLQKRFLSIAGLDHLMDMAFYGQPTYGGKNVSEQSALEYSALFACVRILSETLAYLPLHFYRRLEPRGKERAANHSLYYLLHDAPNPEMTSFIWRETMQGHLATWGNAYSEIKFGNNGQVEELWPLRPDKVQIERRRGKLYYIYELPEKVGKLVPIPAYKMLHIPGLGYDGIKGYSPVSLFRQAIGMGLSVEEYGARFFGTGGKPGGVLRHPGKMKEESKKSLRKQWEELHGGLTNQHRTAILEEGMEYQQIGIPPEDAQFLATRLFQKREMASIYRIPPHMIADLERASFSNIEHQGIDFVVHTMGPWLRRWEQTLAFKLLLGEEKKRYFAEFLVEGLLRGDTQTRYQAYATARQWGWLSANDIRELENQNPLPDEQGDIYLVPMNMIPADQAASVPEIKEPPLEEDDRTIPLLETRNIGAARNRSRLAVRYERVMHDAAARLVKGEVADIRRAVNKHLKERDSTSFLVWLEEYYDEKLPDRVRRIMFPVFSTFADMIQAEAAKEVGAAEGMTPELEKFVDEYAAAFTARYVGSSEGQLRALVRDAPIEGLDPADLIEERVGEWEEKRPGKVAMNDTVQLRDAVAVFVFAAAGVQRLRWVALGSDTCPLCQEMDGKTVTVGQPFLGPSDRLEAEGERPLTLNRPTMHAPLHLGCVCAVVAD